MNAYGIFNKTSMNFGLAEPKDFPFYFASDIISLINYTGWYINEIR